jgi:Outer membrane protein beta-barrel domain
MYYLLRKKKNVLKSLLILSIAIFSGKNMVAQRVQLNLPDHDNKKYHLGIGLLYNSSRVNITQHPLFLERDSVMVINPENTGGFGLAGIHTLRLSNRFEVRAIFPQLLFSYKNITYHLTYPDQFNEETPIMSKKIESILLGLPVHVKFRSDRINNFRVYMFGGGKIEYDLASNARAKRAEDLVKLNKFDYGVEAGIGFQFYFPVFILSPEIKISNGLGNSHSRDMNLKFSNTIDRINSRMVVFSLIFEG